MSKYQTWFVSLHLFSLTFLQHPSLFVKVSLPVNLSYHMLCLNIPYQQSPHLVTLCTQLFYITNSGPLSYFTIATLGLSWNFSQAENLSSLSFQDRPRCGIISWRNQPTNQPTNQPGPLSFKLNFLSTHSSYLTQISNLSLGYWTKI